MKRLIFGIAFCLLMMSVPVHGSVIGDGYGTIGGGETPPPSTPVQQPVITQPEPDQPSVPDIPTQETEKEETPNNEQIEKIYERKMPPNPQKETVSVSENVIPEAEGEVKLPAEDDQMEENPAKERMEVILISLPGEPVIDKDPSFDITPILDVLKIILTVIVSYLVVLLGYAFMFLPRLYLFVDNKYRFATFLFPLRSDKGYRIRIPRYIVNSGEAEKEGKIVLVRSKNKEGQSLDVEVDREVITYSIDHEVPIYISREED